MTKERRIQFVGFFALAVVFLQLGLYVVASRIGHGAPELFYLDPRLGISAWTETADSGFPNVSAWLSLAPLAIAGSSLLWRPTPATLKAYMVIESALAMPSVAFIGVVLCANMSPAHGFSVRELPVPVTVLFFVTVVPLFGGWRTMRVSYD